jgi:hypothetical protein
MTILHSIFRPVTLRQERLVNDWNANQTPSIQRGPVVRLKHRSEGENMTLEIPLSPDLMNRLKTEAIRVGEPVERIAEQLLDRSLPASTSLESKLSLLAKWKQEAEQMDEAEMESNEAVLRAIDENRLSDRKLFADLFDGKTS